MKSHRKINIPGLAVGLTFTVTTALYSQNSYRNVDTSAIHHNDKSLLRWSCRGIAPELMADNSILFSLFADNAMNVSISGEWMPGFLPREPMIKNDSGLWTYRTNPLRPDIYGYLFYVDGVKVIDPSNPLIRRNGSLNQSLVSVPGHGSDLYTVNDVPHGTLSSLWYNSPRLSLTRRINVYTPPGYDETEIRYPVLYLLHGGGGDEDSWITLGRVCQILDNLIAYGEAVPMIVVMPNGNPGQTAALGEGHPSAKESTIADMGKGLFEESLVDDIIPFIESHFRVSVNKNMRALAGLSMGGLQTINITTIYPSEFGYIGVMSMGLIDRSSEGIAPDKTVEEGFSLLSESGCRLYWIGCGKDDSLMDAVQNLIIKLEDNNIRYTFFISDGGHTWINWRIYLTILTPLLFK